MTYTMLDGANPKVVADALNEFDAAKFTLAYIVGSTPLASDWLSLTVGGSVLTPETTKQYCVITSGDYEGFLYRWTGSAYEMIGGAPIPNDLPAAAPETEAALSVATTDWVITEALPLWYGSKLIPYPTRQLIDGTETIDWTPYIDSDSVSIRVNGNILNAYSVSKNVFLYSSTYGTIATFHTQFSTDIILQIPTNPLSQYARLGCYIVLSSNPGYSFTITDLFITDNLNIYQSTKSLTNVTTHSRVSLTIDPLDRAVANTAELYDTIDIADGSITLTATNLPSAALDFTVENILTSGTYTKGVIKGLTDGRYVTTDTAQTVTGKKGFGTNASFTDFPLAETVVSGADTGHTFAGNIGVVGETVSGGANTYGVGVGGICKGTSDDLSIGVFGRALPNATGDTVDCRGVQGAATATHAGGKNIGVYGSASGGANNYSFYGSESMNLTAGKKYLIDDVDVLALKADLIKASLMLYVDDTNGNDTTGDGTISKPVKTLAKLVEIGIASSATKLAVHIAPGTYDGGSANLTLPDKPIVVYGNNAVITTTGTITIPNPYFIRYNLFTTANVVYSTFTTGARSLVFGGGITGNITNASYVEFTECQLNGGTVTTSAGGQTVCALMSPTSKFASAGVLILDKVNLNTNYSGYLVTSTGGQLTITNSIIFNGSTNALAGAVSCDNGATTAPNMIANNALTTAGSAYALYAGTAATIYSKNYIVATSTVIGSLLMPVNTDLIGAGNIMALGSDATGDLYYRNSSGVLTRLGIGTEGQVLAVSAGGLPYWKTL